MTSVTLTKSDIAIEQGLRELYYDPSTGYQSSERLYQKARDEGIPVSRKKVKEWLLEQSTYTRHKPLVKRHKTQRTFVKDLADQLQMDLVDMKKFKSENKDYIWILTAVEVLSRYAFAIPVYRKDTKNMSKAMGTLLSQFMKRFESYPKVVQFDEGKEFYNVGVKSILKGKDIEYFSTQSQRKAAIVERFNRTLKTAMWKYFYANETHKWINILDELVHNYNHTKHSSILMKPADVNKDNKDQVYVTLYGYGLGEFALPAFKVGDTVRISKYKGTFSKGYESNFTEEIFTVSEVHRGDPNMYTLKDFEDEPVIGRFYEEELSPVELLKDNEYIVEKILKRRKGKALVKWLGYDDKHNSWIPEKDIRDLK